MPQASPKKNRKIKKSNIAGKVDGDTYTREILLRSFQATHGPPSSSVLTITKHQNIERVVGLIDIA